MVYGRTAGLVVRWLGLIGMAVGSLFWLTGCYTPPTSKYIPSAEQGLVAIGLDDHDYNLACEGIAREMLRRGVPKDYVVVLGPVDTRECPYDVRVRQLQKSLQAILNKEGTLKFTAVIDVMASGGAAGAEIYKLIEYNWLNQNPIDVEDLQKFGKLARVNGILFGRVSALERHTKGNPREITYRFVWELANTDTGLVDISHEQKIRKNIK